MIKPIAKIHHKLRYLIPVIPVIPLIYFWYVNLQAGYGSNFSMALIQAGRISGLLGAYLVLTQLMLIGRLPVFEKAYGLDRLSRIHHVNGFFALILIVLHPFFLAAGYSISVRDNIFSQIYSFITVYEFVPHASVALILFLAAVFTSVYSVKNRIRYEIWHFIHALTYTAVFLAFLHQTAVGGTFMSSPAFVFYWYALYIAVSAVYLYFRFLKPVGNFLKYRFSVENITMENGSVCSLYIKSNGFNFKPGQFGIFRFLSKDQWWEPHPFSISGKYRRGIRITVKRSGDFTQKIHKVKKGTNVFIEGPYGIFSPEEAMAGKFLFIAGGIGITPIYSIIQSLGKKQDFVLLYQAREDKDLVFKKELSEYHGGRILFFTTRDEKSRYSGRISAAVIKKHVPDLASREVFICGPKKMTQGIIETLKELSVDRDKIHYELFSL